MGERPPVLPISRITLGVTRWRAKVVVLDKTEAQTSKRGHKTQKFCCKMTSAFRVRNMKQKLATAAKNQKLK